SDYSLPEDRDDLAEAGLGVEHDVDRGLEIGDEYTLLGRGAVRQPMHERLADDVLVLMRVQREDEVALAHAAYVAPDRNRAAYARVPVLERKAVTAGERRQVEREVGIDLAAVHEHLGAVRDRGEGRAHAHLVRPRLGELLAAQLDRSGARKPDGRGHATYARTAGSP